jgi:hypothetical protein
MSDSYFTDSQFDYARLLIPFVTQNHILVMCLYTLLWDDSIPRGSYKGSVRFIFQINSEVGRGYRNSAVNGKKKEEEEGGGRIVTGGQCVRFFVKVI